jgi:hypothetical protein
VFNINNAPVTLRELERFAAVVADEIDDREMDPQQVPLILAVDDGEHVQMVSGRAPSHPSTLSQVDQLLATRRRMIALVGTTGWSPADEVPVTAAWVLIVVGRGGGPALVVVRRVAEDEQWTHVPVDRLPWFALSTAGGMRAAIEHGTPLRLKQATATELYRRPDECPDPPVDERGEL